MKLFIGMNVCCVRAPKVPATLCVHLTKTGLVLRVADSLPSPAETHRKTNKHTTITANKNARGISKSFQL